LRIADLTAKNAENAEKEFLFVLFVVKEFFVGLRIADWPQTNTDEH
jgi:hypothetical protein